MPPSRLPAFFLGHGNPMNALERNAYSEAWAAMGAELPRPRAVLCVSAHWSLPAIAVTSDTAPRTIHEGVYKLPPGTLLHVTGALPRNVLGKVLKPWVWDRVYCPSPLRCVSCLTKRVRSWVELSV